MGTRAIAVLVSLVLPELGRETCALVACPTVVDDVEANALTLSVRTTNWMLTQLGTAWDRYRICYKVDARLHLKSKFREVEPLAVAELKEEIAEDLRHNGLLGNS
jgi:hypothetical protein